ncbi:Glyoxalase-like domain-containing protein [Pelagirhabdus alkalitolerans]|uniref:Glyoxalase-like domain-containing protein n=1 Tax=Pelagirhabdus alkalitolerans TaxID=1612202 RepID=A0A1G6J0G2_9BACI|nr:VOC family protein [Pelagirhabdus alkalitolerans]SDC11775.1 Glyoxalase-like domain-containing protein [Pelagirhabdus alkalitolerans]
MAKLVWDHTVHYVNDLEEARQHFEQQGITAFHGGSHKQWGTHNVLSYFDLTYLEFLGVENRELAESITDPNQVVKDAVDWLPSDEGLSRVALRTNDIEAVRKQLIMHGINASPIMPGKRYNAQNQLIEWKMMTISGDFQGLIYPFVIEWSDPDPDRYKMLKENGVISEHSLGQLTMSEAIYFVPDPEMTVNHWSTIFSIEKTSPTSLKLGNQTFIFKQGKEAALKELVLDGSVDQLIEMNGARYRIRSEHDNHDHS